MGSEQPAAAMDSRLGDCCQLNGAPVPQSKVEAAAPAVSGDSAAEFFSPVPSTEEVFACALVQRARSAPFDFQAALCTFLI